MRKHRLRCFFLSFIFIFFCRRNSIRYGVNIVFRLCFCDSKNTIYFIDIQLFIHNTTKEETPWLSSWQHHDSFEKICILSPWIPQNKQGKLQTQTWRYTHARNIGQTQQVYYQSWNTSIWQTSLETPAVERVISVWVTLRNYALPCVSKHRRWKDGWPDVCFCRGFPQGNIRFGNWHHLYWWQGHARYLVRERTQP